MHGTTQPLGISSSPTNAVVSIDKMSVGTTPVIAKIKRGDNHTVAINMQGYAPFEATVTKKVSGWVWGNIVFGGGNRGPAFADIRRAYVMPQNTLAQLKQIRRLVPALAARPKPSPRCVPTPRRFSAWSLRAWTT